MSNHNSTGHSSLFRFTVAVLLFSLFSASAGARYAWQWGLYATGVTEGWSVATNTAGRGLLHQVHRAGRGEGGAVCEEVGIAHYQTLYILTNLYYQKVYATL